MNQSQLQVKRRELKYYITPADYEYTKSILDKLMTKDPYQKNPEGYFIRSLYFDDIYDSSIEEKLAGIEKRDKYRLRIYYFDQDWVKIERKSKYNDYVQKDSGIITRDQAYNIIDGNYEDLLKKKSSVLNSLYFDFKQKYFRPIVIIDYIRDVYLMDFNEIRISFDKKIKRNENNFDLFSQEINMEPIQRDDVIVMEIKYNHFLPDWFTKFLHLENPVRSAVSKYCMSRLREDNYWYL